MNRKEYCASKTHQSNIYKKQITKLLKQWKIENNIAEMCDVHHRDDTEECRKYNEEHYELWGFNLDGTFEYCKYVVFMTHREHAIYHNKGEKNPMYGRHFKRTKETKLKISESHLGEKHHFYGKHLSKEHKQKISESNKGIPTSANAKQKLSEGRRALKSIYDAYKANGCTKSWNDFQHALKTGDITFTMRPVSIYTNGVH